MGNKRVGAPMVLNADADQLMESESSAATPDRGLRRLHTQLEGCYPDPELDDGEFDNRFLGMKGSDYWAEHAGHVRLAKCQRERESELQGIEEPP
jgi:hypothetical protein